MQDTAFRETYRRLNAAQKQAVDTIDGPVLVIAGPGTGKTQLLTIRIANILQQTDTLPENILCLTFTDSAAQTMRDRLASIIGAAAYNITISTYHAFGSELLRRYPAYFTSTIDAQPADDLTIDAIYREITARLPYSNPLKFETFLRDVKQLVSDCKRALLTPDDLADIVRANQAFVSQVSELTQTILKPMTRIDKTTGALFRELADATVRLAKKGADDQPASLATYWQQSLEQALQTYEETAKTTSLTKWKNDWLAKDETGAWICDGSDQNQRLAGAVTIYRQYLEYLSEHNLYDYDDMILQAIRGLETHADLRYTLQERYQYLLLDEFQDTNQAQAHLVELLTDNPVNEGRPNVLAVGDDDQAIYAFQGANYSHMLNFYEHYRGVKVVTLTENYRSTQAILDTATAIAEQIGTRLHTNFPAVNKTLKAASKPNKGGVYRHEFKSSISQNAWLASEIERLIAGDVKAHEIAVLAPKHEFLESLVPYLQRANIAIHYEKRENVLDDPAVAELATMSQLVIALAEHDHTAANSLWAQVLSFDFWGLPTSLLWQLSWTANDQKEPWTDILCRDDHTDKIALFFIRLSQQVGALSLEQMLDLLIGVGTVDLHEAEVTSYRSPFYAHYFTNDVDQVEDTQAFWQLLSNLTVLRERLRDYRVAEAAPLRLQDFLEYVTANQAAGIKIVNTNPYQESADAVELMTAYRAKGQEYTAVFVIAAIDEVWGTKARALGSRLSLPPNLQYVRYAGTTEDERLRLLYVALTRARSQLYITSYTNNYSGKLTTRLKYLQEYAPLEEPDTIISPLLPAAQQTVIRDDNTLPEVEDITAYWQQRHYRAVEQPPLRELLQPRLERFQLSATEFNTFLDTRGDGPAAFFTRSILRFPSAPSLSAQYGNAMHETLEWLQLSVNKQGTIPTYKAVADVFARRLRAKRLAELDHNLLLQRGSDALRIYLKQRKPVLVPGAITEHNFRNEGVFCGPAHLSGKIDKLIVDHKAKTVIIVDYKTGKAHSRWEREPKLHFYKNQLYWYKLLVERSHTFRGYKVSDTYLEFVEPDNAGKIHELHVTFNDEEMKKLETNIGKVWQHVINLSFPSTVGYSADMRGIEQFEADLISGVI